MKVRKGLYPGRHTVLSGYDPTEIRPKQPRFGEEPSHEVAPGSKFENYDNPGGLFDPQEAQQEAVVRAQVDYVDNTIIEVEGNTMGLGVGNLVSLHKDLGDFDQIHSFWKDEDFSQQFLIVGATYRLSIDQHEGGDVAKNDEPFKVIYQLLDSQTQFRPQRTTRKPIMGGTQTALVVGPAGEEIWTDEFGRVRVQFDWDRLGERNEKSSCWVRVSQMWAGAKWGAIHIPRIGHEVIVDFLDGDPDRPSSRGGRTTPTTCRRTICRPIKPKAASRVAAARAARPATSTRSDSRTRRAKKNCTCRPKRTCPRWSSTTKP